MPQYTQPVRPQLGSLKVVELFETVQGEGIYIGVPSVFFRTGMCNLECPGCDTKWDAWEETNIKLAAGKIKDFKSKHVVLTGGEPMLHQDQLEQLVRQLDGKTITVESNGSVPIRNEYLLERVNLWSFSPKVGSLGPDEIFSEDVVYENIEDTTGRNQLKYVLDPLEPAHVERVFNFQEVVDRFNIVPDERVFFQPYDRGTLVNIYNRQTPFSDDVYSKDLRDLTKLVLERSGSRFRVVPQLHKYLSWR